MNRFKALLLLATLTALVVWAGQLVGGGGVHVDGLLRRRGRLVRRDDGDVPRQVS